MSDTNLNDANFTPTIADSEENTNKQTYSATGSFRFWCQKVLPLVYDDSLSYYELLCKVVTYLNNVIQNVDNLNTSVTNTNNAFDNLQDYVNATKDALIIAYGKLEQYVNDYFNNLDVQEEINSKLDEMADNGSLTDLIRPIIPTAVADWLTAHVNPVGSAIIVDDSLTISGAAADAKTTGIRLKQLENSALIDGSLIGDFGKSFNNVSYFPRVDELFSVEDNVLTLMNYTGGSNWVTASFPVDSHSEYIINVESDNPLQVCSYKFTASGSTAPGDIDGTPFTEIVTADSGENNFLRLFFQISSATPDTTITVSVSNITDTITDSIERLNQIIQPVNLIKLDKATDGYYVVYSTGNLSANANYTATDFIPVEPAEHYTLSVYTTAYGVGQMAWYDSNKQYISGLANSGINTSITVKAPSNARFLRWSLNNAVKDTTQLQVGMLSTPYTTGSKIPSKYLPETLNYITVGVGGTYRSILRALKETDSNIKVKVMYGTYDLVQEYTDYYGADFWTNYAGYASSDDPFMRGLWISNGREIEFEQRAIVTFLPDIDNPNIASYFCPFAIGYNAKITGLTLQFNNCRYAVHDDFATGTGKNEYINCRFDGNPSSGAVIGGGCGSNNTYIVDGCVFINNSGTYDISYHNGSGSYNKNLIVVKNSCGNKKCSFRWYGNSDLITDCVVSACKFGAIECVPHSYAPNEKENMKLYSFCNEIVGE